MFFDINDFVLGFDRGFYKFNRNLKDMSPSEVIRKDDKYIIVHNVVGIPKEDIHIELKKENKVDYLVISGETKNEITNKIYSISSRFNGFDADEISGIDWYVKDGLLYVEVQFKQIEKPSIPINYKN